MEDLRERRRWAGDTRSLATTVGRGDKKGWEEWERDNLVKRRVRATPKGNVNFSPKTDYRGHTKKFVGVKQGVTPAVPSKWKLKTKVG
jgi:hypothetical protein